MTTGYAPAFDHDGFQQSVAASGARALDLTASSSCMPARSIGFR